VTATCPNVSGGWIFPPIPFSPCPLPPPPPKKEIIWSKLPRNLHYLFIPPENEHACAKLIEKVYLKKKTLKLPSLLTKQVGREI